MIVWARLALQCSDNIHVAVGESDGVAGGTIDLATSHTHANYVLLPAILAFTRRFPQIQIGVEQGTSEQVAELVRDGKAMIGVLLQPEVVPKEIVSVPFLEAAHVLVAPAGHPLLDEDELTLDKIAAYPIIIQNPARPQGARMLQRFQQARLKVQIAVQALV